MYYVGTVLFELRTDIFTWVGQGIVLKTYSQVVYEEKCSFTVFAILL